jgi:hypothetical protein
MCMFSPPKPKPPPPPAQYQQMQVPKDMAGRSGKGDRFRRRGMWSSVFTSPVGIPTRPSVTGGMGGLTGA